MNNYKVKKDCFAYLLNMKGEEECAALRCLYCKKENCKFYLTEEEYHKKQKAANESLKEINWKGIKEEWKKAKK